MFVAHEYVLNHLYQKGFPAAKPVPYMDGQYFCAVSALEGRRYIAIFTEAPGSEISYANEPLQTAQRYGRAVAQMHNALDDFSSPHPRFQLDLDYFTERPLRFIKPFLTDRQEDWRFVQQFAGNLRQRIFSLPSDALELGYIAEERLIALIYRWRQSL